MSPANPTQATPATTRGAFVWPALALFLLIGILVFPGAGRDDTHITYWPAYALAETGALTNYNGEFVEQSSSLATVLVLAGLRAITGAPLAWIGWGFGIVCGLLTILLCGRIASHSRSECARFAPICLALAHPFTYWSFSGMETAVQALLFVGWILAAKRASVAQSRPAGFVAMLPWTLGLCAVRPEAMFVLLCVTISCTLFQRERTAQLRMPLWSALLLSAGSILLARWLYFGSLLPQPAHAKAGRELLAGLTAGISYLASHPLAGGLLLFAAALALLRMLRKSGQVELPLYLAGLLVAAQLGFTVLAGGDWMEGGRFLAPALPLAFVLVLDLFKRNLLGYALAVGLVVATAQFATTKSRSLFAWQDAEVAFEDSDSPLTWVERRNLVHLRDAPLLEAFEQILQATDALETQRTILTGQGGMVLYHLAKSRTESLRVVDRYGLMDRHLSGSAKAKSFGASRLGLDLSYRRLLLNWDLILAEAQVPEPEFVFGLGIGSSEQAALKKLAYVEIYSQSGHLVAGSKKQPARQAIFSKYGYAEQLPKERLSKFEFSKTPID